MRGGEVGAQGQRGVATNDLYRGPAPGPLTLQIHIRGYLWYTTHRQRWDSNMTGKGTSMRQGRLSPLLHCPSHTLTHTLTPILNPILLLERKQGENYFVLVLHICLKNR